MAKEIQEFSTRDEAKILDHYFGEKRIQRTPPIIRQTINDSTLNTSGFSRKRKTFGVVGKQKHLKKTHQESSNPQIIDTNQEQDENRITNTNSTQSPHKSPDQLEKKELILSSAKVLPLNSVEYVLEQDQSLIGSINDMYGESCNQE